MPERAGSRHKPSDICVVLCSVLVGDSWLAADEIAGRLKRLGFELTTQQTAAYLKRLSRMDAPPIAVRKSHWGQNEYGCTQYGKTWLGNLIPWARTWR